MARQNRCAAAALLHQPDGRRGAHADPATMGAFTFHSWLIVEIFTDSGLTGIGNAALSPRITKQVIDLYLKPLAPRRRPVGDRVSLAAHVPQDDGVWPKRHRHGRHQRVDIALWEFLGKSAKQPVYRLLGGRTNQKFQFMPAVYTALRWTNSRANPRNTRMKATGR